jgi:AcrR family transcriptional regulator
MTVTSMTTTRDRHADATRGAILDAAQALLLERRNTDFSVQEVADRAGLAHRTVYRYFPTRQELVTATARLLAPGIADDSFRDVSTVEEWIAAVRPHLARTEANIDVVRRILAAVLASDDLLTFGHEQRDRDAHRWDVFRSEFPGLAEDEARRLFLTLRHLTSSATYVLMRLRFEMPPDQAVDTIERAARELVERARGLTGVAQPMGRDGGG